MKKNKSEKIKVFLQFPWGISDSQYYKNLIEYPPENVVYITDQKSTGMITSKRRFFFMKFLKRSVRNIIKKSGLIILNAHKTNSSKEYDLIHCAHCLSSNDSPWVADFESFWQMWVYPRDTIKGRKKVSKILCKENCKKIIAWTEEAKKEIVTRFPEIKDKLEIVYHGVPVQKFRKQKSKQINLLFIGRYFYEKGGLHALEVLDRITRKHENVRGVFISPVPKKILEKYSENKKIEFYDLVPHKKIIDEIYPKSDILIYPGYSDTFGFLFTEALSFGIPVITAEGFGRKELVEEGKTGFIVNTNGKIDSHNIGENEEKIIKDMTKKTEILISNRGLRNKMSKECLKCISDGKFSIKQRNEKLKKIYENALR